MADPTNSNKRVLMGLGRGTATEEAQGFQRTDLMPGTGGNQHCVARPDLAHLAINLHDAAAI